MSKNLRSKTSKEIGESIPVMGSIDDTGYSYELISGKNGETHVNHLSQQGAYLLAYQSEGPKLYFSNKPIDEFFSYKFQFDVRERERVLNDLNRMNINEHTLLTTFKDTFTFEMKRKFLK